MLRPHPIHVARLPNLKPPIVPAFNFSRRIVTHR